VPGKKGKEDELRGERRGVSYGENSDSSELNITPERGKESWWRSRYGKKVKTQEGKVLGEDQS